MPRSNAPRARSSTFHRGRFVLPSCKASTSLALFVLSWLRPSRLRSSTSPDVEEGSDQMPDDVEVVRLLFAAVEDRDIARVLACYSDNVEITEADVLPYGGVWRGQDGADGAYRRVHAAWGELSGPGRDSASMRSSGCDAGTVCAVFRHQAVDPLSGKRFDAPEVGIYRVSDGRVVQSQMFHADSAAVKTIPRAMSPAGAAPSARR